MNIEAARYRAGIYEKIRKYFQEQSMLEVETPLLSRGSAVDCYINPLRAEYTDVRGRPERLYLQTSPELFMKRLLAAGYPGIFQICKSFRGSEEGCLHNPEFTILEWYRPGFGYSELMDDVAAVCRLVLGERPVEKKSYRETFLEYTGLDPWRASVQHLTEYISSQKGAVPPSPFREDLLNIIMAFFIQPRLPRETFFFIYNYPMCLAALAREDNKDHEAANRFELFFNSVELCNGYEEITEAAAYGARFEAENARRVSRGLARVSPDGKFLKEMEKGLSPCSGVALGVDRLIMLGMGLDNIQEVMSFPFKDC